MPAAGLYGLIIACCALPLATGAATQDQAKRGSKSDRPADLVDAEQALAHGQVREARRLADRHVAAAPDDPRGHYLIGVIHDQQEQWEQSIAAYDRAIRLDPRRAAAYQRRGVARFMLGQAKQAVEDFDRYLELQPDQRPHHWQRGIALYYAGRYEDGAKQFELHQTVNESDVENSAWHFLCVAKWKGIDAARKSLIDVKGDERVPMMQVQAMLEGKAMPDDVLAEAKAGEPEERALRPRMFYAHLYLALYHEALGEAAKAKEHITLAADKYHVRGYMGGVAKVHLKILAAKD